MTQLAVTLVHQGAMPIAVHAVRTFAHHFSSSHHLEIHTDGSVDDGNQRILIEAATGMAAKIVTSTDRRPILKEKLADYVRTRSLIDGGGYFAKLELPMVKNEPYFYFDSDIVWLRHSRNLVPVDRPNAFSTESWSWYNGIANDRLWILDKVPRRVNSGFYYLGEPFPFERMERLLYDGMFDPEIPYNTDQEIMAYLYRDMMLYHPEDLKRSRRDIRYDLATDPSVALHFPGQMWRSHMDQIKALSPNSASAPLDIRYQEPAPLTKAELLRMRWSVALSDSRWVRGPINRCRGIRRWMRSRKEQDRRSSS